MAGNSSVVNIEVRVDDKGGVVLRQLGESARTSASQAEAGFKRVGSTLEDLNRKAAGAWGSFRSGAGAALDSILSLKTALIGLGLGLVARDALNTTAGFESMTMSLKTLTGSMEAAKAAAAWIEQFTARTPYQLAEVTEAYKKLLAYGFDPKKFLGPLGDAASALGKTLDQAVEAVADASTGEFERLKEFGLRASAEGGKVALSWREHGEQMQATVANTSEAITGQLVRIFSQYRGAMAEQMDTWNGMWSNLMDSWSKFERLVLEHGPFAAMKSGLKDFLTYLDSEWGKINLAQWALDTANAVMASFQVMTGAAKYFNAELQFIRLAINGLEEGWLKLQILYKTFTIPIGSEATKELRGELQALKESLVATQIEGIKIVEQWQQFSGNLDGLKKRLEGFQKAGAAAAQAQIDAMKAAAGVGDDLIARMAAADARAKERQATEAAAAGATSATAASAKEYASALDAVRDRTAELTLTEKELAERKIDEMFAKYAAVLGKTHPELKKLVDLEREHLAELRAQDAWQKEYEAGVNAAIKANQTIQQAAKDRAKVMQELSGLTADAEAEDARRIADAHKDAAEESKRAYEHMAERVQDATSDAFYTIFKDIKNGWKNVLDSMLDWFLKIVAEMASKKVLNSVIGTGAGGSSSGGGFLDSIFNMFGGSGQQQAGGTSNGGGFLDSLFNMFGGSGGQQQTGSTSGGGSFFDSLFNMFGGSGGGSSGGGLFGLFGGGGGAGYGGGMNAAQLTSAYPGIGGPTAGGGGGMFSGLGGGMMISGIVTSLYQGITSAFGVKNSKWGGLLGMGGGLIGSIFGPIGAAVGSLIGNIVGSFINDGHAVEDLDLHLFGSGETGHKGGRESGRYGYKVYAGDFGKDFGARKQGEELEQKTISYLDEYFTAMEDAFDIDLKPLIAQMDMNIDHLEEKLDDLSIDEVPELMLRKLFKTYLGEFKDAIASSEKAYATTLVKGFDEIEDRDQLKEWLDKAMPAIQLAEEVGGALGAWMDEFGLTLSGMGVEQGWQNIYGAIVKQKTGLEQQADQINAQFDGWVQQFQDLGVDQAFLDGLEAMRDDVIAAAEQALRDEWNYNLDQREMQAAGQSGEAAVQARRKSQEAEYDAAVKQFGEGSAEVARLLAIQTLENEALARAMAETIESYHLQMIGNQEGAAWAALQAQHEQTWQQAVAAGVDDADLAKLEEAMRIENELFALQWEFAKRERSETLQIRMLRAQGDDAAADALERQLEHERELLQARLDGWSAEDMAMLRQVQAAEDAQRAQEEAAAAAKEYADAIERANDRFSDFRSSIQDWLNSKLTEESPATSPQSRLEAAQSQFWATYQKAMNGDWQAAESMTGMADTYLAALEAMYGSTAQYQQGYQDVIAAMQALPNQKLYEAAVLEELKNITSTTGTTATNTGDTAAAVDSIPAELRTKLQEAIEAADVDYSGGMNSTEFQKYYENNKDLLSKLMGGVSGKSVGELFKILDGDGDGQITPLEIENYTGAAGQDADLQAARELTTNQMLAAHAVQLTALVHNTAVTAGAKGWEGTGWTNPFADSALMNYWPTRNSWIKALAGQSIYTRASGGPVWPEQPFLVGEEGPEWFVPQSHGTILDAATSRGLSAGVAGGDMGLPILRELQAQNRLLAASLDQSARENEELKDELKDLAGEVRGLKKATRTAAERRAVK